MNKKNNFINNMKAPIDASLLSTINLIISLISFKNLIDFFQTTSFESWVLLSLVALGLSVSVGVLRFQQWSFPLFHVFASFLCLVALGQTYIRPTATSYYALLAVITYSGLGSMILNRHFSSACFRKSCLETANRLQIKLAASLKNEDMKIPVEVMDISKTGCFLKTDFDLKLGSRFQLSILVDGFEFNTCCRVIRESSKPEGYGLMFTGVDQRRFLNVEVAVSSLYKKVNSASPVSKISNATA